jgi:hypothetical protein
MPAKKTLKTTAAALLLISPFTSEAAGLGEADVRSRIGEPLRLEVAVVGDDADTLDAECVKLANPPAQSLDDLPWLREAQIRIERSGGASKIFVTTRLPVPHPVMMIGLSIVCGAQVRRDYPVLLMPGPEEPVVASQIAPRPQQPTPARAAVREPVKKARPVAPRTGVVHAPVVAPKPEAAKPGPTTTATQPGRDRLTVGEPAPSQSIPPAVQSAAQAAEEEEKRLQRSLDEKIASEIQLTDRIRQLETAQKKLEDENRKLQALIVSITEQQKAKGSVAERLESLPVAAAGWIAAALAAILGLLAWRRSRRHDEPREEVPVAVAVGPDTERHLDDSFEPDPPTIVDIWPDRKNKPGEAARAAVAPEAVSEVDWVPSTVAPEQEPASLLMFDDAVEEHDSAVELAEIMMSFGRIQGAAETLAEFIRSNPKQAVKPWVKLLEVYRAANMRVEFDALAHRLNKTFNVKAVTWADFDEVRLANDSVEQMPHVLATITDLWRTRDAQAYLHRLLRDNRQGTRQGFPLGIVDDLLMLSGVLEIELGTYKPTPEEIAAVERPAGPAPKREEPPPPPLMPPLNMEDSQPPVQTPDIGLGTWTTPPPSSDFSLDVPELPVTPKPTDTMPQPLTYTDSMIEFNLDEDWPEPSPPPSPNGR